MNVTKGIQTCRKQTDTCCQRDTAEQEGYGRGHHSKRVTENNTTNSDRQNERMLERFLSKDNLNRAYVKVMRNKGAGGIDKMTTDELLGYLREHREALLVSVRNGNYKSQPVRRVEIPVYSNLKVPHQSH